MSANKESTHPQGDETFDPAELESANHVEETFGDDDDAPPSDPFDPRNLRIDADQEVLEVEPVLAVLPVKKPSREAFIRVCPDENYRISTFVLDLKDDREIWLVAPALRPQLLGEPAFTPRLLVLATTTAGDAFLWPLRTAGPDGRLDDWARSALAAADAARSAWVRIFARPGGNNYTVQRAKGKIPEPTWPTATFAELLRIAFADRYIEDANHPVLRKLRGES